jgi:glycosyltransferase involved in cell wall biosynthesis
MAEAVSRLLEQPEHRLRMGQVGRERVRSSLAWDHQGARYTELFNDLASRRRRPVGTRAANG